MDKIITKENCLATRFPKLASEWDFENNDVLTPHNVSFGSHKKVWWVCPDCNENYESVIHSRTMNNSGCPYCSGNKVCNRNCLATKFPDIAKQWHPTLNNISPKDVASYSSKKAWWICEKCHENYEARIADRSNGKGCSYCAGKITCNNNCLATKRPDVAKEWHPTLNGNLTPKDVMPVSGKKIWWLCPNCNEAYNMQISNRTNTIRECGCPYCAGRRVCENNCLATTHPNIAKLWHPIKNGELTPHDIVAGTQRKFWWFCAYCKQDTLISCAQTTQRSKKTIICPKCNLYYQEEQIRIILEKLTGKKFPKAKFNIPWLINYKTGRKYELDGYCEELNIAFEHQGEQHFIVSKFYRKTIQDFFYQLYKDADKYRLCKENNCALICTYYNQSQNELEEYIRQKLIENNIRLL